MEGLWVLVLAIAWDLVVGEPPAAVHPVVWMGKAIGFLERGAPRGGQAQPLLYGIAMSVLLTALFAGAAYGLLAYLKGVSSVAYVLVGGYLLKSSFSLRGLHRTGTRVRRALADAGGDLTLPRREVQALVSRKTGNLDEPHLASAAVESLAENVTDSLVAPTLFFLVLGVPGALAYRAVNTLDAMLGYRGPYEYLGKFAARLDDVLNYIPARLAGVWLVMASATARLQAREAWRVMLQDASRTQSPNAGWPMAAAAGALGVQLEKLGYYRLGRANRLLSAEVIDDMLSLLAWTAALWWGACLAALLAWRALETLAHAAP
jgi:adenosylcobinamide-phosphate synthase